MMKLWKGTMAYTERTNLLDLTLLQVCSMALGVLVGVLTTRKKKPQTALIAGGLFAATCVPIMNKFLDITEEIAESK